MASQLLALQANMAAAATMAGKAGGANPAAVAQHQAAMAAAAAAAAQHQQFPFAQMMGHVSEADMKAHMEQIEAMAKQSAAMTAATGGVGGAPSMEQMAMMQQAAMAQQALAAAAAAQQQHQMQQQHQQQHQQPTANGQLNLAPTEQLTSFPQGQQQQPLLDSLPKASSGLMLNRLTVEQQQQVMSSLQGQQQNNPASEGAQAQPAAAPADQTMPEAQAPIPLPATNTKNNSLVATLMEDSDADMDEPLGDINDDGGGGLNGTALVGGLAVDDIVGVSARDVSPITTAAAAAAAAAAPMVPEPAPQGPFADATAPVSGGLVGSPMRPGSSAAAADSEAARVASLSGWMHGSPAKVASPRGTPAGPTSAAQLAAELPAASGGDGDGQAPAAEDPPAQ
jgi:hypothetical protein